MNHQPIGMIRPMKRLITRVANIVLRPDGEWQVIATEQSGPRWLSKSYLPLA